MNLMQRNIGNFENPLVESNHALGARMNSDQNENSVNSIGYSVIGLGYLVKVFLAHFEFVTKTNCWNEPTKTVTSRVALTWKSAICFGNNVRFVGVDIF
ncbi:hypothetical protein V1477_000110 [Vespula maculifrons]|uniref:Uncharacterized protein n=1 Tax=Vespula maculifrons TaxID=7453 RepID=A0ABD2D3I8_VESMC